ncbi:serine hydrolase [Actinomadura spongiicola]|uniref:Serine hydrolase n=1 Tax=Actinomadura spongiicola TaxID=2303421 RepID=A0A372GLJ9_9ACTN|nr:serine hydrolase [Actinomadura spongiicola]RFS86266.1 serine hydrolase [Actinomadura spongiicola]
MRRHLIVLALAAGATGAGFTAHWFVSDEPKREGVVAGATESAGRSPAGRATVAGATTRPFDAARLRRAVRAYIEKRPGKAGVMATDLRTGLSFGENEKGEFVSASVMKVDILASLVLQRQRARRGLGLSDGERDLASSMIRVSDNSAADSLYSKAGHGSGVTKSNKRLGLVETTPFSTSWGSSTTSPADQVRLLRDLVSDTSPIGASGRQYILGLMGSVVEEQAWGVSAAALPGEKVALKNGWTPVRHQGTGWTVNSIGRITGRDHDFLVAVCSGDNPTMGAGVTTVEHVAGMVVSTLRASRP